MIRAAARLAALYSVGVAVLWLLLAQTPFSESLAEGVVVCGVLFVVAFITLALARRFALPLVWGLMLVYWIRLLVTRLGPWGAPSAFAIPGLFALWTVPALPIFAIASLAAPDPLRQRRRHALATTGIVAAWLVLAIAGRHFAYLNIDVVFADAPYRTIRIAAWLFWAPAPFVLAALTAVRWHRRAGEITAVP